MGSGGTASWDMASLNWSGTGGATAYADGDAVNFSSTSSNNNITITSAVATAGLTFSNGATSYSFSGAPITNGNSASVTLTSGAGLVTFGSSNSYGGGTIINGGTLVSGANLALGSGGVTVNSPGVLDFTSRAPSITALGGGGNVVLGGPVQSTNLTVTGGGSV